MRVDDITWGTDAHHDELSARLHPDGGRPLTSRLWFRVPRGLAHQAIAGDPFVAALLIPCMHQGEDLHVDAPISPQLLANTGTIQAIFKAWNRDYRTISVTCPQAHVPRAVCGPSGNVGVCFSNGVDSWYTFLKHEAAISHLVLIRGFNVRHDDTEVWPEVRRGVEEVAAARGKELVVVETNVRSVADKGRCPWGRRASRGFFPFAYFGSVLCAVGLVLQGFLARLFVPSSYSYATLMPQGSHVLVDPLWSTERLTIVHDGCEADRVEKTMALAARNDALDHLHVCLENRPGEYNCGQCEKCLRTMACLRVCGALSRARTFHRALNLRRIARLLLPVLDRPFWEAILPAAIEAGDEELARAVKTALGQRLSISRCARLAKFRLSRLRARSRTPTS